MSSYTGTVIFQKLLAVTDILMTFKCLYRHLIAVTVAR